MSVTNLNTVDYKDGIFTISTEKGSIEINLDTAKKLIAKVNMVCVNEAEKSDS